MKELSKISVVLPSLDPDNKLLSTIDGLLEYGFTDIIVVNDGSKSENLRYFEKAAKHPEVHVLHHAVNRGKGAALKTAFTWFLENREDFIGVVTVDGDGQHHPKDTQACALHMRQNKCAVLGVRDFSLPHVPKKSRQGNRITSFAFKVLCGMRISDTQTGLRALPTKAVKVLSTVKGDRFEYETNMLLAMKENGISFDEVKIDTLYDDGNKGTHFRPVKDSIRIYALIFGYSFKYVLSSLLSSTVDAVLLALLVWLLNDHLTGLALVAVPVGVARLVSSLLNFFLNKQLVFHSHVGTFKALCKYYLVAIPTALTQFGLELGFVSLLKLTPEQTFERTATHVIIMVILFLVGFVLQRGWVFRAPKKDQSESDEAPGKEK